MVHTNSSLVHLSPHSQLPSSFETHLPRSSIGSSTGSGGSRSRVTQEMVERVKAVFPGVSERGVRWELERNGGSVERAVERALREGGLPEVRLLLFDLSDRWKLSQKSEFVASSELFPSLTSGSSDERYSNSPESTHNEYDNWQSERRTSTRSRIIGITFENSSSQFDQTHGIEWSTRFFE